MRGERVQPHQPVRAARRRAISVASSSGSPRSHPSERMTTTAPRPMRRPCSRLSCASDVADPRAARPVARRASAARRSARSGSRPASSRVMRVRRVPNANASTRRRAATARLHVLEQHPRVGLHRARHVEDQHERPVARARGRASGARAARRRSAATRAPCAAGRGPRRAARRTGARAPACAAAARARASRASSRRAIARSRSVYCGEVLLAQQLDLAPRRGHGSSLELAGARPRSRRGGRRRLTGRARQDRLRGLGDDRRSERAPAAANDRVERRVEHLEVLVARAQRGAQREVELVARRGVDDRERAVRGEQLADAAVRTPPARSAAANSVRRAVSRTPGVIAQAPPSTPCARTRSMSSRTFSAAPSVASRSLVAERDQRLRPRERLPDARQLVELRRAQPRRPRRHALARSRRARRAAARARSRPRGRATGSRSSGRGSGA